MIDSNIAAQMFPKIMAEAFILRRIKKKEAFIH
jgi:hypothetical protein